VAIFTVPSGGGAPGPPGPAGPAGPAGVGVLGLARYQPTADYPQVGPVAYPVTTTQPYRVIAWAGPAGASVADYSAADNYPNVSSFVSATVPSGALPYVSNFHRCEGTPGFFSPLYQWTLTLPVPAGVTGFSSMNWYQRAGIAAGVGLVELTVQARNNVDPSQSVTRPVVVPAEAAFGVLSFGASAPLFPAGLGSSLSVVYSVFGVVGTSMFMEAAAIDVTWT